jgi:hypothetical protein
MKRNWIKMYSKEGSALRVETVINEPDEFRIRRRVRRQGRHVMASVPMRKGVVFLPRYGFANRDLRYKLGPGISW